MLVLRSALVPFHEQSQHFATVAFEVSRLVVERGRGWQVTRPTGALGRSRNSLILLTFSAMRSRVHFVSSLS